MTKPLKTSTTIWGKYETMAERPSVGRPRVTHPVYKTDLGEPFDRLLRCTEGRKVHWNVGYGVGSDGCAYGGGMNFKTKKAALAVWNKE